MIQRSLVPKDAHLPAETPSAAPRRFTTLLDERAVIAGNLPRTPLEGRSSIPSHLPLGVLASRVVVPRDTPDTPLNEAVVHPEYAPVTVLDERFTVPVALPVVELEPKLPVSPNALPEVVESDVFTTGEINLMVEPVETPFGSKDRLARIAFFGAAALNVMALLLGLLSLMIPNRVQTQQQVDLAQQQLTFVDPGLRAPAVPPGPRAVAPRIDPNLLRKIAPSTQLPIPAPRVPQPEARETPPEPVPDLPEAPKPQVQPQQQAQAQPEAPRITAPQPQTDPQTAPKLILPQFSSPGRALNEAAQNATNDSGGAHQFGFQLPGGGGGGLHGGGGGGGTGYGSLDMLSPTDGVNFDSYLQRVVDRVRTFWYSEMPESVYLGEKGIVVLQFRIMRDGSVPQPEPVMMRSSSKDPLDHAAAGSIRASSPFEPLPAQYDRDYIELRFTFLYNEPVSAAQ